jgi:hypothetical protein
VKIIDFSTADGDVVGSVTVTDAGKLQPDLQLQGVVRSWEAKGGSPAEFATFYDGWTNGYMNGRIRGEKEGTDVATTPKLGSGARFKKLAAKVAGKGASDADAVAGSDDPKKKFGGRPFGRLAARSNKSK